MGWPWVSTAASTRPTAPDRPPKAERLRTKPDALEARGPQRLAEPEGLSEVLRAMSEEILEVALLDEQETDS